MNIKISTSLFSKKEFFIKIDRCFYFFFERRYVFYLDDETILETDWLKEARAFNKELLMEAFENTVSNSLRYDIEIADISDIKNKIFSLDDALMFLNNPVYVLLENAANDSKFIISLLSKFKNKGKKARRFIKNGWLRFQNGGGKNEIINQLNHMLNLFEDRPLDNKFYLKIVVIVDSDKKSPNDIVQNNILLENYCNENGFSLHILEKREMENYIPIEILYEINDLNTDRVKALEMLDKVKQDYYDLDEGFKGKSRNKLDPIFQDISVEQYNLLKNGFSEDIDVKKEFPELFLNKKITQEMLIEKCSHHINDSLELTTIIEKIDRLL